MRTARERAASSAIHAMWIAALISAFVAVGGCVNIVHTRNPWSCAKIERIYQSTGTAFGMSILIAFPQAMAPIGSGGLVPANIISIPIGCLCLVDVACESVIDTVCLPVDWPLAASRKKKEAD